MPNENGNGTWKLAITKYIIPGLLAIVAFFIIGFFNWNSQEHEKLRCDVKEIHTKKVSKEQYVIDMGRVENKLDRIQNTLENYIISSRGNSN